MVCGTEKYTIKSQSPCPSGIPDCQLVLYKLSTRPVYTQKQKVFTTLQWRCCPGHGGHNCEDTVPDPQLDPGSSNLTGGSERTEPRGPDEADATVALLVPHMLALVMSQLQPVLQGFNRSLEHLSRQVGDLASDVAQLKSSQRGAELRAGPLEGPEIEEAAEERLDVKLGEVFQQLREVRRQMESQRTEMENRLHSQHAMLHYNLTSFKTDVDMKLKHHQKMLQVSLQAMNTTLSELKLDQDQANETQLDDHLPLPSLAPPRPQQPSDSSALWLAIERLDNMVVNNTVKVSGLMEDVEVTSGNVRWLKWDLKELEKQINRTARNTQILFMETGLEVEDAKVAVLKRVEELAGNLTQHDKHLQEVDVDMDYLYVNLYQNHSAGDCDCKGLKAAVVRLETSLANVTALANENRLALDEDSEGGAELQDGGSDWEPAVEALQRGLQQAKESLASEQSRTRTLEHSLSRLGGSVTLSLAEVSGLKERDKKLREEMQHLSSSFTSLLKDAVRHSDVLELLVGEEVLDFLELPLEDRKAMSILALKEQLRNLQEQLTEHNLSITTLLGNRPGGREEVPSADQPSSSHLLPDDWLPGGTRRSRSEVPARERQLLLYPDMRRPAHRGDGSDLWNLEKTVEELGLKVHRLAEKPCPCPNTSAEREVPPGGVDAKLQAEVTWLKRGLEEHLRVFKNVFSNADVLAGSDATLELDKLWQLVKNKNGKKEKKGGGGGGGGEGSARGGNHRNTRDLSGVGPVPSGLSEDSLLFVAGSPLSVSNGVILFEASLNRGRFYSDTGTFTAPVDGIYMFILTLDLRPGPTHVVLRRGSGGALVSLHRQKVTEAGPATGVGLLPLRKREVVRLELRGGAWGESEDNVFTGMLLHRTT
ncbi:multimerin-2a isoform X1 [Xiphias gladius]|uniref:multimerin-2a isoform X1 n=1 Tax=Xiphias gladius TaxID=8245 RepID=UPI001A991463|nr:multimerin-2a isoform X1 [Xiphias gladius]